MNLKQRSAPKYSLEPRHAAFTLALAVTVIAFAVVHARGQTSKNSSAPPAKPRPAAGKLSPDTWKPGPGWKLVWSDEFAEASINSKNWTFDLGAGGWETKSFKPTRATRTTCLLATANW